MRAVFTEVNADESQAGRGRELIKREAVPRARDAGARAGYWLHAQGGRGIAVLIYDCEDAAKRAAEPLRAGEAPPGAPAGVTLRTAEVREVLAALQGRIHRASCVAHLGDQLAGRLELASHPHAEAAATGPLSRR
jgi:hypothetical protein